MLNTLIETKNNIKLSLTRADINVTSGIMHYGNYIRQIEVHNDILPNDVRFAYSNFNVAPMFDTSYFIDMSYMFNGCKNLIEGPLYDTSNVIDMTRMFGGCSKLKSVPLYDTSNVKSMFEMFIGCARLTSIPLFDTSNVKSMDSMFYECNALQSIPLFDTSNVTNMSWMCYRCFLLKEFPLLDTSNVTNMSYMFYGDELLQTIPLLNARSVTDISGAFYRCIKLENLGGFKDLSVDLDLHYSFGLTYESIMNVINNLAVVNTTKSLKLHSNTYTKLTDEDIAIATNKGWTVYIV